MASCPRYVEASRRRGDWLISSHRAVCSRGSPIYCGISRSSITATAPSAIVEAKSGPRVMLPIGPRRGSVSADWSQAQCAAVPPWRLATSCGLVKTGTELVTSTR